MELIARFLYSLTVYGGWLFSPLYTVLNIGNKKALPPQKQPDILNNSAIKLAQKIRTKELSSEQVVRAFIERCKDVNGDLNAVVEDRYADALEEAKKVDQFLRSNERTVQEIAKETPLLGVPITVKEACAVRGMSYAVGATLRDGVKATEDAKVVENLKKAGAIPIAVTNTPELCCSIETYNSVTGYTKNPYNFGRTCGGSSGGEASLISSGSSAMGIGSDFGGSIRIPCLFTGIFGHKPSAGVVSNDGHYPNQNTKEFQKLLTLGPMSRYAEDLKPALKIISGKTADLLKLDEPVSKEDLDIYYALDNGFMLSEISVDSEIKNSIQAAVKHFQVTYGCTIEKLELPELTQTAEICVLQTADMENLREVLLLKKNPEEESSTPVEMLKGIFNVSDYNLQTLLMRFIVDTCLFIPTTKKEHYKAIRDKLHEKLKTKLGETGVFFFPTFATAAHYRYEQLWKISSLGYPMIINVLGFPATHVPTGMNKKGMPVGFQVIAAPNQDRLCLAVAEELEKVFGGWIPPPAKSSSERI